jgi:hypothetical protein
MKHSSSPRVKPFATASTVAPGVVQVHLEPTSGTLVAYFVNSADIPAGSSITGYIMLLDDGSFIDLDELPLSGDLPAGSTIFLPTIGSFGDLWQVGSFQFGVQVITTASGTQEADGFAALGEPYAFADLPFVEPVIGSMTQNIAKNQDMILAVTGYFTGDAPTIVFTDIYFNYLVPSAAIVANSTTEIDIDLSQLQGMDLTTLNEYLITISQDGFADTTLYRYIPGAPGTFNPASSAKRSH